MKQKKAEHRLTHPGPRRGAGCTRARQASEPVTGSLRAPSEREDDNAEGSEREDEEGQEDEDVENVD